MLESDCMLWINFLIYPKKVGTLLVSKLCTALTFACLSYIGFSIMLTTSQRLCMLSFSILMYLIFLSYNFLIPDGYINTSIINPGKYLGFLFMMFCLIYNENWFDIFVAYAAIISIAGIIVVIFILLFGRKRMKVKVTNMLALDNIMPSIKFVHMTLYGNRGDSKAYFYVLYNFVFSNKTKNKYYWLLISVVSLLIPQLKIGVLLIFVLVLLEQPILIVLSIFANILIIIKTLYKGYQKLKITYINIK